MLPYSVNGVQPIKSGETYLITAVDRVTAIEATQPVQRSWVDQSSFGTQLQHAYRTKKASRDKSNKPDDADDSNDSLVDTATEGSIQYIENLNLKDSSLFLPLPAPEDRITPDFITKRKSDLMRYL